MGIDNYLGNIKKKVSLSGLVLVLGLGGFFGYDKLSEYNRHNNLNPDAFWAGGNQFEAQYGKAFLKNKDLDGDGKYETVIRYVGGDGKYHELEMRLNDNGFPQVVIPRE